MAQPSGPMRLKEWLIAQIESGRYPGLRWENRGKTLFRIPWKHAAKQDYRQQEDAALFRAWAIYKGKYHEGTDKADPSTWKTRLRCALNKSTDFQEAPERSQLDISEPYKVYQIVADRAQESEKESSLKSSPPKEQQAGKPATPVHRDRGINDKPGKPSGPLSDEHNEDKKGDQMETTQSSPAPQVSELPSHPADQGYRVKGVFYGWSPTHVHYLQRLQTMHSPLHAPIEEINSDCWLHVRLYYRDVLVKEFTTRTAEGCRITYRPVPADNESIYGPARMEQVQFPSPRVLAGGSGTAEVVNILEQLLPHLDRGVLLWVAPEGVFMKRQCQGRVYWNGPLAPHSDRPNKLEREKTYKLLDTQQFLQQLRGYLSRGERSPQYQIQLCFGEEYPAAPMQKLQKFIMAHVEPVFARELFLHAQQMRPPALQDSRLGWQQPIDTSSSHIIHILKQLCQP
uniref:IRF tryptophan pentad repeat domain-containing protein n=1 Tax=Sphenodon punctatus TaxID=8508 RepID=A0A8D0HHX7_SPHPU